MFVACVLTAGQWKIALLHPKLLQGSFSALVKCLSCPWHGFLPFMQCGSSCYRSRLIVDILRRVWRRLYRSYLALSEA